MMSIRFCLSLTVSQLMDVCDPPEYTHTEHFLCSVFVCCGHCSAPVTKEAVGVGRELQLFKQYSASSSRIHISCTVAPFNLFKVHWSLPWALVMFLHISAEHFLRVMRNYMDL